MLRSVAMLLCAFLVVGISAAPILLSSTDDLQNIYKRASVSRSCSTINGEKKCVDRENSDPASSNSAGSSAFASGGNAGFSYFVAPSYNAASFDLSNIGLPNLQSFNPTKNGASVGGVLNSLLPPAIVHGSFF